jgi:hypothetical protein
VRAITGHRDVGKASHESAEPTREGRRTQRTRDAHIGDYESAMFGVRHAMTDLEDARAKRASRSLLRQAHGRIDEALARAAAAATDVYTGLFNAAGGMYHAETDPDVAFWKRRMNTALTLRSQHQMAQVDEEAALPIVGALARTRAAFGPLQAGLDFGVDHDATSTTTGTTTVSGPPAGSTS